MRFLATMIGSIIAGIGIAMIVIGIGMKRALR